MPLRQRVRLYVACDGPDARAQAGVSHPIPGDPDNDDINRWWFLARGQTHVGASSLATH